MALTIEKSLLLSQIEKYYESIPKSKRELDILLPSSFNENSFASKASLCQVMNTWVRKTSDTSNIHTHLLKEETYIENFTKEIFGLSICLMTIKQGRKILDRSKTIDLTKEIFKKAIGKIEENAPRVLDKQNEKAFIGKTGPIRAFCFDHSAVKHYQYNEWFYQDGKLLDETGMRKFYVAAIKHLFKPHKKELELLALRDDTAEKVTGIIKELFENTDKHATRGFGSQANIPLNPNLRGVFMEVHKGHKKDFISKVEAGDPLFNYFNNPKLFEDERVLKTFIEVSVIDSGPGFAQRKSGSELEDLNPLSERNYVIECLTQYDTSASKRGLKRVASYLGSKGGFLRLRTGRMCLYWDFLLHGYKPFEHQSHDAEKQTAMNKFFDWKKADRGWTKLNEASGSLITVFYPLD